MTDGMRKGDWLDAARAGATLGHYVGDIHVALHCTKNFNGQETRQHGVHTRIESDMAKAFIRPEDLVPPPAEYLPDVFHATLSWIADSYALVPVWLEADIRATAAAGDRTDTEDYYTELWALLGDSVKDRQAQAIGHLASIWYTAWVDAGRPAIPRRDFDELPTASIFSGVEIPTDGEEAAKQTRKKPRDPSAEKYDLVFLDAPPVLAVSESTVIGSIADAAILVVHGGRTSRKLVRMSVRQLETRGTRIAGLVINSLDMMHAAHYGYSSYYAPYYTYDYRYEEEDAGAPAASPATKKA